MTKPKVLLKGPSDSEFVAEIEVVIAELFSQSQHLQSLLSPSTLRRFQRFFDDRLGNVQLLKVLVRQFAQTRLKKLLGRFLCYRSGISLTHKPPPDDPEQKTSDGRWFAPSERSVMQVTRNFLV